jgi:hypothetical protein
MIRTLALTLIALFTSGSAASATPQEPIAAQPKVFDSESAAQERCPKDNVVWLNTNTDVYHHLSVPHYGHTHRGGYVCESEAVAAGAHEAQGKDR